MADRRGALFPLLILTWIMLSPTPQTINHDPSSRTRLKDVIADEQHSLEVLRNSSYMGNRFDGQQTYVDLNLTGFESDRGYAWNAWPHLKPHVVDQSDWTQRALKGDTTEPRPHPLYSNVTGYVHGRWARSALEQAIEPPHLNLTDYAREDPFGGPKRERHFGRNFTGTEGDVKIQFTEKGPSSEMLDLQGVPNITEMNVQLKLGDDLTGNEHEMILRGFYFQDIGHAVLTTTSPKFAGIFALPHFTPSDHLFDLSRTVLNESLSRVIQRQVDRDIVTHNPWSTTVEGALDDPLSAPRCELVVWLQQLEPTYSGKPYSSAFLSFLERELRFPTGSFLPPVPEMHFEMTAFSPDCGYILSSQGPPSVSPKLANHLTGPKAQVLAGQGRHHLLVYMVALGLQLALIKKQMGESCTPSTRSRISFYTIFGMAIGDGFTTLACATLGAVTDGLAMDLMAVAFMSFTGMLFFGMQFLMQIWNVQAPELRQRERVEVEETLRRRETALAEIREAREQRLAAARANATTNTNVEQTTGTNESTTTTAPPAPPPQPQVPTEPAQQQSTAQDGSLPLPATAPRPENAGGAPLFYMPSDQAGLQTIQPLQPLTEEQHNALVEAITDSRVPTFGYHYARFFLVLFGIVFISINATGWPSVLQRAFFTLLAFVYLSFWVPQISRNVQRNCRRALEWDFVLGQSALRLLPFAYFYAYPHNILFASVDYYSLAVLVIWSWLQVVVLASQDLLGPRWFVRETWVPPAYDYHPVLRYDEEGATLPLGASNVASAPTSRRASVSGPEGLTAPGRRGSLQHKESKDKGKRVFDCAICMQDLEVPVIEAGESGDVSGGFMLARRQYMVTPCRHIFHTPCLEGWMKYRLQCPNCREGLPPL
ncbi:hypothetical protein Q7P37_001626 [Cladosporium fusiforme]